MTPDFTELRKRAVQEGGPKFLGCPDRWWANPRWRCTNGHVSVMTLKSEELRRDACLACLAPVHLTFPEDKEGPLCL